jgi:two-component system CitB family response regulator
MIRTLVVEDDFRVAELHRDYTERVDGFTVVGTASTGAEAIAMVARLQPDLLLLDIHLPDMSGIEVMQALRQPGSHGVDVIAITAAKEVETLRAAMHGGVVHYLVKPFRFSAFEERLRTYAAARERLARLSEADQREVDKLFGMLRAGSGEELLPKGLSSATLSLVLRALRGAGGPISAEEVAAAAGLSRVTARRYLDHLAQVGQVELRMRYGGPGRPEHRYRLLGGRSPAGERPGQRWH